MKIKLSDYVARFIASQGIRHVFVLTGGASVHLIQSLADTPGVDYICPQHEQAGAMAADGYARITGNCGVAVSTSGPGATNLLTGVACAYYDSIPAVFISGQVATFRSRGDSGVRQIGFQETDTIDIFRPVTKYVCRIDDPEAIRRELEKAFALAREGRPGPVLLDIPDDIQRRMIDPEVLESYVPPAAVSNEGVTPWLPTIVGLFEKARRPVLILGAGVRLAKAEEKVLDFVDALGFPVAPTWAAADLLPSDHPLCLGTFGTHGTRHANFAVQNADLILSIGSRLDTKATGSPGTTFAREATKIVVDIDPFELKKFGRYGVGVDLPLQADAAQFMSVLRTGLGTMKMPDVTSWAERTRDWKKRYPVCLPAYYGEKDVNPYVFVKALSRYSPEGDAIVVDTGCAIAWMMQGFEVKRNQRLLHDWNNTAMGWALPASIAASLARNKGPVSCVVGDGSLLMNIQELATVVRYSLPIKIFLINNGGYSMIRQTQDQWLNSHYHASSVPGGLPEVDFESVARSFGIHSMSVSRNADINHGVREVLAQEGPVFCNVIIDPHHRVVPQVKFGRPNEDSEPLLPREEFLQNMIVKPLEVSRSE